MANCTICFESFNKSFHKQIICPYCNNSTCRNCTQTYIKNTTQPNCPNTTCTKAWTEDFLSENFTKTFLLNEYKECRENILLDIEKARLPETQEFAIRYKYAKDSLRDLEQEKEIMRTKILNAVSTAISIPNTIDAQRICESFVSELCFKQLKSNMIRLKNSYGVEEPRTEEPREVVPPKTMKVDKTWTFNIRCPNKNCEGFIDDTWECKLCVVLVCKHCHECIKKDKGKTKKEIFENHVCDKAILENVKAIKKEAKPCPKCASMISKVSGCNHMWCTQCHVAFDWKTGVFQVSAHNPHYFEWMRNHQVVQPNEPLEPLCLTNEQTLERIINSNLNNIKILRMCRFMYQLMAYSLQYNNYEDNALFKLRVMRLVGEINDDTWKDRLQRIDKIKQKNKCVKQIIDTLIQAGMDIVREIMKPKSDKEKIYNDFNDLRQYCESSMDKVKSRFNNKVPDISYKEFITY